jgi:hypothetical protein
MKKITNISCCYECPLFADCDTVIIDGWGSNEGHLLHPNCPLQDDTDFREELIEFFRFFRDNGERHIGQTIEGFVDFYLKSKSSTPPQGDKNVCSEKQDCAGFGALGDYACIACKTNQGDKGVKP